MENNASLREMLKDKDPYVRRDACESIADSRAGEFIPDLVGLLKDENAGVKEAALNALNSIGGRGVAEAIAPLLRLEDATLRNIGIEILEHIGGDALDTISGLLDDEDDDVVKFGVDILANIREERAVGMLSGLVTHRNPNVRASVAVCLGRLKADNAVPFLLTALHDSEEWVKFSAIEGLGLMHDSRALVPLLGIIEREAGLTKEAAIEALSKIASPVDAAQVLEKLIDLVKSRLIINVPAISELLEKAMAPGSNFKPSKAFKEAYFGFFSNYIEDSERSVRKKAIKGISRLNMPEALTKIFAFINNMQELDEETESLAVDSIITICGYGPLPSLLLKELKQGGKSLKVIVKALGAMKSIEAVPVLEDLMHRVSKHELREVVSALEAIGSIDSVGVLMKALKDHDGHTRKIASRAIASLAGPLAAPNLFEALKAEVYKDVMEEMTDVLALIPSDEVKKGFCRLLSEEKEELREMGARGLGVIGDEEALYYLEKAANDKIPNVRKMSYKSMARLGIPEAVDLVLKGLGDPNEDVKLSVLKALGGWGGEKIKEALVNSLKDSNIWIRYHAVLLLGDLGENDIEPLIIDLLLKDEAPVKAAAARALEKIGSAESVGVLREFLDHPDPSVRSAVENAIEALGC